MEKNQNLKEKLYPYIVWFVASLVYVIVFFHRVSTGVVREEVLRDFGLLNSKEGGSLFALLASMYFYAYTFMQVPTGVLADTLGPRKTITFGSLLAALGAFVFSSGNSIAFALVGRFIVGIGVAVVFVSILKIIADYFPKEMFATMSGVTGFVGNMGAVLAMTPLALLTSQVGWRNSFRIIASTSLILAVLCFVLVKDKKSTDQGSKQSGEKIKIGTAISVILKNKRIYPPMLAYALTFGACMALTGSWGITLLIDVCGVTKETAANNMAIVSIGVAIGCAFIGKISDMMGSRKTPMLLFAVMQAICWIIFILTLGKLPLLALNILFFAIGFTNPSFVISWAYAKEQNDPKYSGIAMSVMNFAGFLGAALIPQVVGIIYDSMAKDNLLLLWQYATGFLTLCLIISVVCMLVVKEEKNQKVGKDIKA